MNDDIIIYFNALLIIQSSFDQLKDWKLWLNYNGPKFMRRGDGCYRVSLQAMKTGIW